MEPGGSLVFDFQATEFTSWNCLSCPFVYVHDGREFNLLGEILIDRAAQEFSGLSTIPIPLPATGNDRLRIRITEEKNEITYIDHVVLRRAGVALPLTACLVGNGGDCSDLSQSDGLHLMLREGEWVELEFSLTTTESVGSQPVLCVEGYYEADPGYLAERTRDLLGVRK